MNKIDCVQWSNKKWQGYIAIVCSIWERKNLFLLQRKFAMNRIYRYFISPRILLVLQRKIVKSIGNFLPFDVSSFNYEKIKILYILGQQFIIISFKQTNKQTSKQTNKQTRRKKEGTPP